MNTKSKHLKTLGLSFFLFLILISSTINSSAQPPNDPEDPCPNWPYCDDSGGNSGGSGGGSGGSGSGGGPPDDPDEEPCPNFPNCDTTLNGYSQINLQSNRDLNATLAENQYVIYRKCKIE